jgi:hypothetical protein
VPRGLNDMLVTWYILLPEKRGRGSGFTHQRKIAGVVHHVSGSTGFSRRRLEIRAEMKKRRKLQLGLRSERLHPPTRSNLSLGISEPCIYSDHILDGSRQDQR